MTNCLQRGTNSFAERALLSAVRAHGMSALLQAFPKLQIGSCEKDGFGPNCDCEVVRLGPLSILQWIDQTAAKGGNN